MNYVLYNQYLNIPRERDRETKRQRQRDRERINQSNTMKFT